MHKPIFLIIIRSNPSQLLPNSSRPKDRQQSDIPVSLKLCPDLNGLLSPQISSDVPVKGVDKVSLVERLDVESMIPVSASELLVQPKNIVLWLTCGR